MKTILGFVMALLASSAAAQSITPLNGNGAVVAPGGTTPPVELLVRGIAGNAIPGVVVTFEQFCTYRMRGEAGAYACVSFPTPSPTATTDAVGRVTTPAYTADLVTGNAFVLASAAVEGRPVIVPVYWTVGTTPVSPIHIVSGNNQTLVLGSTSAAMVAQVRDDFGQPVAGMRTQVTDHCQASATAPCLLPSSLITNLVSDQLGNVNLGSRVANNFTGSYFIRLAVEGAPAGVAVDFNITNVLPPRSAISKTATGNEAYLRFATAPNTCALTEMRLLVDLSPEIVPTKLAVPEGIIEVTVDNCPAGTKLDFILQHPGLPEGARVWTARPTWKVVPSTASIEGFWGFSITDGEAADLATESGRIRFVFAVALGDADQPNFQDLWWAGPQENGWGMSIVQHRDVLFVVVYAFDAAGEPTWYVMPGGSWSPSRDYYIGSLYHPRGRPLSEHTAGNLVMGSPVGTLQMFFEDTMTLRAAITINGQQSIKFLDRMLFGPREVNTHGRHDDMWWGGASRNGWGLSIHQQFASLFSVLFTYGADGKPVWFAMPSGIWTSEHVYEGLVYKPSGPTWPAPYDPVAFVNTTVGAFKLDFADGTATFDFNAEGRSSRIPISRLLF